MIVNSFEINNLIQDGFILKKNILTDENVTKIKEIIKLKDEGKAVKENHYSVSLSSFIIKIIKFDITKIKNSLFFLDLKKKLNLDLVAKNFFKKKSNLTMVDGYYNKIQKSEILQWHSDQAYSGAKNIDKIVPADFFHLKFFFYLTDVGPNNGCTSYIPGSHKITYAVRSCLYENKIKYEPFWEINDLVNLINKKDNYAHIVDKLDSKIVLNDFLNKANLVILNKNNNHFDFHASPGDLLIFNEGGLHRGSMPSLNERVVLRYLYS